MNRVLLLRLDWTARTTWAMFFEGPYALTQAKHQQAVSEEAGPEYEYILVELGDQDLEDTTEEVLEAM